MPVRSATPRSLHGGPAGEGETEHDMLLFMRSNVVGVRIKDLDAGRNEDGVAVTVIDAFCEESHPVYRGFEVSATKCRLVLSGEADTLKRVFALYPGAAARARGGHSSGCVGPGRPGGMVAPATILPEASCRPLRSPLFVPVPRRRAWAGRRA